MALNLLKNLQSIAGGDVRNDDGGSTRVRDDEDEGAHDDGINVLRVPAIFGGKKSARAHGSDASETRYRDETPRFEVRERLASAAARAMARHHVRAGCLCYIDDGAASCLARLGGLKTLVAALGAYHCGRLSDREAISASDGHLVEDVIFVEHQAAAAATAAKGDPHATDIVVICTGLLTKSLHDDIAHLIGVHCKRRRGDSEPLVLRVHVLTTMPEEVYARLPSSELGESAYSEFRRMLLRHRYGGGDDDNTSVHLDVSYFPLPMKLISDAVFTLPSDAGRSLGGRGSFSRAMPPIDAGQELDNDEALTPEGVVIEAAALSALASELGVKLELFALGPASRAIGRAISDMPPTPMSVTSTKGSSGTAALVLVDRTLDVATPCCHSDSVFDRYQHATTAAAAAVTTAATDDDRALHGREKVEVSGKDAMLSTPLYSIEMGDEDSRLWTELLTSPARDAMLELRSALRKALHAEEIHTQSSARSTTSIHALAAEVKELASSLAQHSTACCYRHRSLLAVVNAAVRGIEETGEVWDAFSNAELVLGMSGASEGVEGVSQQLEEYISKVHFSGRDVGGDAAVHGLRMSNRRNMDMSLEEILSLAIIAYVFAGELSKKERVMSMRSERHMKAALVDALERCVDRPDRDGVDGTEEATARPPCQSWLAEVELAAEAVAEEEGEKGVRRNAPRGGALHADDADAWGDFDDFDVGGTTPRAPQPPPHSVKHSSGWDDEWGSDGDDAGDGDGTPQPKSHSALQPRAKSPDDDWGSGWDDIDNSDEDEMTATTTMKQEDESAKAEAPPPVPSDEVKDTMTVRDLHADTHCVSESDTPGLGEQPTSQSSDPAGVNSSDTDADVDVDVDVDEVRAHPSSDATVSSSMRSKRPLVSSRVARKPLASKLVSSSRSLSSKTSKPKLVTRVGGGIAKTAEKKRLVPGAMSPRVSTASAASAASSSDASLPSVQSPSAEVAATAPLSSDSRGLAPATKDVPAGGEDDRHREGVAASRPSPSQGPVKRDSSAEANMAASEESNGTGEGEERSTERRDPSSSQQTPASRSTTLEPTPPPLRRPESGARGEGNTAAAASIAAVSGKHDGRQEEHEADNDRAKRDNRVRRDLERRVDLVFKSLNDVARARRHSSVSKDRRMQMLMGVTDGDEDVDDAMSIFTGNHGHHSIARRVASCIAQGLEVESLSHSSGIVSGLLSGGLRAAENIFGVGQGLMHGTTRHPHDYKHVILYFVGGVAPGDVRDAFDEFGLRGVGEADKTSLFVGGSAVLEQDRVTKDLLDWSGHRGDRV